MAIKLTEYDCGAQLTSIQGLAAYDAAWVLLRLHGRPLGWLKIDTCGEDCLQVETLQRAIAEQQGWALVCEATAGSAPPAAECTVPPISVLVWNNEPGALPECLAALARLDYPAHEILLTGNALPDQPISSVPIRSLELVGSSFGQAVDQGITAARNDIVAIIGATARPDRNWARIIATAFKDPAVAAVTGPVVPSELVTQAQVRAERQIWGIGSEFRYWQIAAGTVFRSNLVGLNLALRRDVWQHCGGFDTAMRAGAAQEFCGRLVDSDQLFVYEPAALVWHQRPRSRLGQWRLALAAGRDFGATLRHSRQQRRITRLQAIRHALGWSLLSAARAWRWQRQVPGGVFAMQVLGLVSG